MWIPRLRYRTILIAMISIFLTWMFRHFQLDDSLIYARYVRNALLGRGLVYNVGEHVNALTSPLYSALALLAAWLLHGHVLLAGNVLFCLFFIAACVLAERIAPWSGLLIVSTAYFYICIGMETSLFLLMLMLLVSLYLERQEGFMPLVATSLVLTRLEGAALVLVLLILLLRARRMPSWRSFLAPIALVVAYFIFNQVYYGRILPSSGVAKMAQAKSGYWGKWPTAFLHPRVIYDQFHWSIYMVPLSMILALWGIWKLRRQPISMLVLPSLAIIGAFYVLGNFPYYHWYYAPFVFFMLLYAVMSLPQRKWVPVTLAVVILQCVAGSAYTGWQYRADRPYFLLGKWLAQNTAKDARVASVETGTIGWFSDRYIDDLLGLTSPENAMYLEHHDLYSWLNQQKPDYVVMHSPPSFGEVAAAKSKDYEYVPLHFGAIYLMRRKGTASK